MVGRTTLFSFGDGSRTDVIFPGKRISSNYLVWLNSAAVSATNTAWDLIRIYCVYISFNASLLLESIRGKRMLYVGDSLNRGQFFSMVCLVQSLIPVTEKSLEQHDNLITFHAKVRPRKFSLEAYLWDTTMTNMHGTKTSSLFVTICRATMQP